jgi:hypothetical protein
MDGRRARLIGPVLDSVPRLTKRATTLDGELKLAWAALLGVGWPVALVLSDVIRPSPVDPNAAPSLFAQLFPAVVFTGLVLTAIAAASRMRTAAVAGVGLGALMLFDSLACPLSGHHQFGLWVAADFALFTGMLGLSITALGHRARATEAS